MEHEKKNREKQKHQHEHGGDQCEKHNHAHQHGDHDPHGGHHEHGHHGEHHPHHHHHHEEKEKDLFIFVNRLKFDKHQGVKKFMGPNDIAKLVDLTAEEATVRWAEGPHAGEEVTQPVEIHNGDQFIVVRKQVRGGLTGRVETELSLLRESGQEVELNERFVVYKKVPTGRPEAPFTDVMVPIPAGYPAAMLDRAALPVSSPLMGRVPGQSQEIIQVAGISWHMISYHPHAGGGGKPWNPQRHGFHTYLTEVLAWLRVRQ